jgi:signal transduction histidine kinase
VSPGDYGLFGLANHERAVRGDLVRFDDRLATVLAQSADSESERQALWRQLTDLLAQEPGDAPSRHAAFARLREWRSEMPEQVRRSAAAALAWQELPDDLILFFAEDMPSIAAPVLGTAFALDAHWAQMIPLMSPVGRALLRHRRDLGPAARWALDSYGAHDLIIPAPAATADDLAEPAGEIVSPPGADESPQPAHNIAELVARIAAFREGKGEPAPIGAPPSPPRVADEFRFEAGANGVITWCDLDARGAVIGLSISSADETRAHGVDGQAAGAFRRRASFRDARLTIAGEGAIGGEWRISAVPVFDQVSGRFCGYRGSARRPRLNERAELPGLFGTSLPGESLRQLAHEIRTPLNAIIGFAEMIDRQILGPVNHDYRHRAEAILTEARQLLATVDDLETAARIDARALKLTPRQIDAAAFVAGLGGPLGAFAAERGVAFDLALAPGLPPLEADPVSVERMIGRLGSALIGIAAEGETVAARLEAGEAGSVRLSFSRPAALGGRDETSLLDPSYGTDGDLPDAPVLGLGFTLRLVRGLADAIGGRLTIEGERFVLVLPATAPGRSAVES